MIPVVDLFAGPGGLGEGFSAYNAPENKFKISVSIENDEVAHKTLLLRAFYRQFEQGNAPDEYYEFIKKTKYNLDELNALFNNFDEGNNARSEALCLELGKDDEDIFGKIGNRVICFGHAQHFLRAGGGRERHFTCWMECSRT